uniref:Protein FAR1-RELATED SEQUENCE n=1 Tax=Cajanus cajan TaxID=3821 RepID=A0A151TWI9_CAJCA|nr:hypothetical protein KK1_010696 [Cajanus cajan]
MKIVVEKIFNSSSHRFCMWHIMKKVFETVGVSLNANKEFNSDFKCLFLNPHVSLVEFWIMFDSAIEAQRQKEILDVTPLLPEHIFK